MLETVAGDREARHLCHSPRLPRPCPHLIRGQLTGLSVWLPPSNVSLNTRLKLLNGSVIEVDDLVGRKGRVAVVEIDGAPTAVGTAMRRMPAGTNCSGRRGST
jgi:hypothetical protein